jgi:hypothetical protein
MFSVPALVAFHSISPLLSHYLQASLDHLRPRIPLYAAQFANHRRAGADRSALYNAAAEFARMHYQENQIVTVPAAGGNARTLWLGETVSKEVPTTADPALPDDSLANGADPAKISVAAPGSVRRCDPAMPQDEWDAPIPFNGHQLPHFPVHALPDWLRDYVQAEATATQTPADLAGMLVLTAVAAACAKKVEVKINEGYVEPVNIFTVTALPPGSRKSAVFDAVVRPIAKFEEETKQRLKPQIAEMQSRNKIDDKRLKRLEKEIASGESEDQQQLEQEARALARDLAVRKVPSLPKFIADDATPEKLASLLAENDGRIAVLSAEGGVFDIIGGRYGSRGTPNMDVFLKGHTGDDLHVDRVEREEFVKRPALTLGLAVQPDVIRDLADKPGLRERGVLARFFYSMPKSFLGHRNVDPPPVPVPVTSAYHKNLESLLSLPVDKDGNDQPTPHYLKLSEKARQRLMKFAKWIEPQLGDAGDLVSMREWAGKLAGAVVRIAGILHMAQHAGDEAPWSGPIEASTMRDAIQIGQYLIPHAQAAFDQMGADPLVQHAKYVQAWMARKGLPTLKGRDIFEGTKGRFKRVAKLDPVLDLLVDHRVMRRRPPSCPGGRGRPPSDTYDVNPHILGTCTEYGQKPTNGQFCELCE